ncbi:MAG: phage tail tape measure protein [Pseudomonadota bacterium]
MADATRTIDLIFNGVDRTGAAVQGVLNNTNSFAGNIQTASQPLADFATSAVKFEAALLSAGAVFAGFAVNEAASFESALAELNKVLDDTDSLEDYADLARELSREYGVAVGEIVGSIADFKQAGFTAEEAGILTRSGLDLVIAGGVEASRASDLVVASLKGFGAEAQTVVPFVDLLNQVSNEYAVSVDQLLEGFATFSPIARSAGLSLQETVGVLTPGIEVFRSGSEVANALRTSFLRLQDDSKPVQEALSQIGVSQRDANGDLRSGRDIFFDVATALQGVDENQRAYLASQLVGIQRSSQFLATIDGLDKALRIAGDGFQFFGSASKEVEIQLATFNKVADRVRASFVSLLIDVGTPLLDEFGSVAEGLEAIFTAIGENVETGGLGELTDFVEANLDRLSETLARVARNLPAAIQQADFGGFIGGLEAIGDAFSVLLEDVDLSTVEGLTRAIELLGGGFSGLSLFTAGVIESFQPLFELFRELVNEVDGASQSFRDLGNLGGFAIQINQAAGAVSAAIPVFEGLLGIIAAGQGVTLVKAFGEASVALAGRGGLLGAIGSLGQAGAALGAGAAIGTLANEVSRLATGNTLSSIIADWALELTGVNDQARLLTETIVPSTDQSIRAIREADESMSNFNGSIAEAVDFWGEYGNESGQVVGTLFDLDDVYQQVESSAQGVTAATQELVEATEEISLEEKLAVIEASAAVAAAEIQANAQTISSAFDSISVTVDSTGDSLSELFSLLGDDNISKFDKLGLKDQIELENERRQESLDLQERLVQAQIRELNLRAQAYQNGGALIEIDGAGLQPHLEAFMYTILEEIQVRVAGPGGEGLLLGVAA